MNQPLMPKGVEHATTITKGLFRFTTRAAAWGFALHGRAQAVVLGDDGYFWVTTMGLAHTLERQGYTVEYTPR